MKIKKYLQYLLLISLILADIIIYIGLFRLFKYDTTLIAGCISFMGALIGGGITYFGVRKTIQHRDKEVFLNDATEKLMINEELIDTYKSHLNSVFILENMNNNINISNEVGLLNLAMRVHDQLVVDNSKIYKCLDYDAIKILSFHKKGLNSLCRRKKLNEEQAKDCIEKIRLIFNIFYTNQKQLEDKYYKYKNS